MRQNRLLRFAAAHQIGSFYSNITTDEVVLLPTAPADSMFE